MAEKISEVILRAWNDGQEIEVLLRAKVKNDDSQAVSGVHDVVRSLDYEERCHEERPVDMHVGAGAEDVVPLLALGDSVGDSADCPCASGAGEWLRVRNGITVDSGSAAFVVEHRTPSGRTSEIVERRELPHPGNWVNAVCMHHATLSTQLLSTCLGYWSPPC